MKEGILGANFFFKRGGADRNSATKFCTTICAQLLVKVPALAVHVETALDADPCIPGKSITLAIREPYRPLSNIQDVPLQANRLVIVVVVAMHMHFWFKAHNSKIPLHLC